jgi:hypothetical protein
MRLAIPMVALSEALVRGRLISGIAGSNPAEGMDIPHLCMLYVV